MVEGDATSKFYRLTSPRSSSPKLYLQAEGGQKLNYSSHCCRSLLSRCPCSLAGATSLMTNIF